MICEMGCCRRAPKIWLGQRPHFMLIGIIKTDNCCNKMLYNHEIMEVRGTVYKLHIKRSAKKKNITVFPLVSFLNE